MSYDEQGEHREAGQTIIRGLDLYRRGIVCPAVFWELVTSRLTPGDAGEVLASLREDQQVEIRAIREARPWSLRSDFQDDPIRRQVERWCVEGDATQARLG